MHREETTNRIVDTYQTVEELFKAGELFQEKDHTHRPDKWAYGDEYRKVTRQNEWSVLRRWAIEEGWAKGLETAQPITEAAIRLAEREMTFPVFRSTFSKKGGGVSVGRYLAGRPDCMVKYEPVKIARTGKVVTLVVGMCYSGGFDVETVLRRGSAVVALATALQELQHQTEIWIDCSAQGANDKSKSFTVRCLVKRADESIAPAQLAYWLAHPTVLRRICFGAEWHFPQKWILPLGIGGGYGSPSFNINRSLYPSEAIILEGFDTLHTRNPQQYVIQQLTDIGLLEGEG